MPTEQTVKTPLLDKLNGMLLNVLSGSVTPNAPTCLDTALLTAYSCEVPLLPCVTPTVPVPVLETSSEDDEWFWRSSEGHNAATRRARRKSKPAPKLSPGDVNPQGDEDFQQNLLIVSDLVGGLPYRFTSPQDLTCADLVELLQQYKQLVSLCCDLLK